MQRPIPEEHTRTAALLSEEAMDRLERYLAERGRA